MRRGSQTVRSANSNGASRAVPPGSDDALYRATFEVLEDCLAILVGDGTIRMANAAWRHAAVNGSAAGLLPPIGSSLLEAWRALPGSEPAILADGLREILAGSRDELVAEWLDTRSSAPVRSRIVARPLGDDQPGA
jgi:hypothetical protein